MHALRDRPLREGLLVSAVVTALAAVLFRAFHLSRPDWVPSLVAAVFLGATWLFVWRLDDAKVVDAGLSLGGFVLPGRLDLPATGKLAQELGVAAAWAVGFALVVIFPYAVGWKIYFHIGRDFSFVRGFAGVAREGAAQLLLVALPEEAFYRGYLQTTLDHGLPGRLRILGADVGPSLLVTSAIFAVGHFATIPLPGRLAVFFPSLAFGWLRIRTKGIGASCFFHAICNLLSHTLSQGYGLP